MIPGSEDPLEEEMTTHFSILAWKIHGQRSLAGIVHGMAKSRRKLRMHTQSMQVWENDNFSFTELRSTTSETGEDSQQKPGNLELGVRKVVGARSKFWGYTQNEVLLSW